MKTPVLYLYAPQHQFLLPYFQRQFDDYVVVTDPPTGMVDKAVMISSTDIYATSETVNESSPINVDSPWLRRENDFKRMCEQLKTVPTILRVPEVIATGMSGLPMRMARGIVRGTLMKVRDNQASISLIHGVDVANYAFALAGENVCVNVTDGYKTTVNELIDALAYRLKNKAVYTLAPKWARLLYGAEYYKLMTTNRLVDNMLANELAPQIKPNVVVEYLKNHVYDEESL